MLGERSGFVLGQISREVFLLEILGVSLLRIFMNYEMLGGLFLSRRLGVRRDSWFVLLKFRERFARKRLKARRKSAANLS